MTSTTSDDSQDQQALVSQSLGPWPHCPALIWEHLVDFKKWPQWCSGFRQVKRLDSGVVGRGSRLQIETGAGSQIWEIIYWEPGRRLDFEIDQHDLRCGYSFQIRAQDDPAYADLDLYMEILGRNKPLFDRFRVRTFREQARLFMREFSANLEQSPGLA